MSIFEKLGLRGPKGDDGAVGATGANGMDGMDGDTVPTWSYGSRCVWQVEMA